VRTFRSIEELAACQGEPIGQSDWVTITQDAVNLFADATGDHQWIHVDPERAAGGPFGMTIGHGYLTLSLLPVMSYEVVPRQDGGMAINYGLNKVRFPAPVPVGSKVRAQTSVVEVTDAGGGAHQVTLSTTVSIEGGTKPACVAESVVRYML
jgi:acyl dehydratase